MIKAVILSICLFALALCTNYQKENLAVHILPDSIEYQKQVEEYWTPERMLNAIPYELVLRGKNVTNYKPEQIRGTEYVATGDYQHFPYKGVGKVYFTQHGTNYVCSGSVAGNSAVLTAGHCVSDGRGTYHSNWIFKPAFRFKDGPAGSWTARKFITFDQYHNRGYLGRDVAFAIVNRRDNKNIEQVVGGRLGFKRASFGEPVIAIGYPLPVYGGYRMVRSDEKISLANNGFNPPSIGISSNMKGGCSGGPWVCEGTEVCSVNSYTYEGQNVLYGPTFDSSVASLRNQALLEY